MVKGIEHISIISRSEKSVEFYSRLGFKEFLRKERQYDTVVILKRDSIQLVIFIDANHPQRATDSENLGLRNLYFEVDDLEEIRKEFDCGSIMKDWFGQKYCLTLDPDGVPIGFLEKETKKSIMNDADEDWIKEHIQRYGKEPNPFDGV